MVKDVLGIGISVITYQWLVERVALTHLAANSVWAYLIGFIVVDFQGYWIHRWSHEINFLWNRHIIHHSSEEFNLSCALRQVGFLVHQLFHHLLLPAALLGVPTQVVAVDRALTFVPPILVPYPADQQNGDLGIHFGYTFTSPGTPRNKQGSTSIKTTHRFSFFGTNGLALFRKNCQKPLLYTVSPARCAPGTRSKSISSTCGC